MDVLPDRVAAAVCRQRAVAVRAVEQGGYIESGRIVETALGIADGHDLDGGVAEETVDAGPLGTARSAPAYTRVERPRPLSDCRVATVVA